MLERGVYVHGVAAQELGRLGSTDSAPEIARLLEDPAWQVRTFAAVALFRLRSKVIAPELVAHLNEPNDAVLRYLIRALGSTPLSLLVGL